MTSSNPGPIRPKTAAASSSRLGSLNQNTSIGGDVSSRGSVAGRRLQHVAGEAQLVEQFECRWMDGVAADIAKEVAVLLENDDVDAGAGEQETEDGPGGATARDCAGRRCHGGSVQKQG